MPDDATTKWTKRCLSLQQLPYLGTAPTESTLRDLLCELDACMRAAPLDIRKAYHRIDEGELAIASAELAATLESEGLVVGEFHPKDTRANLFLLAVAIRAVDELLRDYGTGVHALRSAIPDRWLNSAGTHYAIPTRRPRTTPRSAKAAGYDKRGLLHHHLVPRQVSGLSVDIAVSRTLGDGSLDAVRGGCALFPDLTADVTENDKEFLISDVGCEGMGKLVQQQARVLFERDFAVWPELTMDDERVGIVSHELQKLALERGTGNALVVAGSWHREDEDGTMRNRAPILDGKGRKIAHFDKIAIFADEGERFEAVTEGGKLVVLVWDGFLATVCICKDFSDLQDGSPWTELPVDLVLVASMGEDKTMQSHLTHASVLRKGYGRRTVVAQQGLWNFHEAPTNYLLPAPDEIPSSSKDTHCEETAPTFECEL